jgi:hypothetical protein
MQVQKFLVNIHGFRVELHLYPDSSAAAISPSYADARQKL